jgi:hypothetical protein
MTDLKEKLKEAQGSKNPVLANIARDLLTYIIEQEKQIASEWDIPENEYCMSGLRGELRGLEQAARILLRAIHW